MPLQQNGIILNSQTHYLKQKAAVTNRSKMAIKNEYQH